MDDFGDERLARTAGACEEDRLFGRRHPRRGAERLARRGALPDGTKRRLIAATQGGYGLGR
jgi:hypothetical protein